MHIAETNDDLFSWAMDLRICLASPFEKCIFPEQARDRADLAAEEVRVKSKLEADWFSALRAEYNVGMEDVPMALAAWKECCNAGKE